jgi:hypothetical protein
MWTKLINSKATYAFGFATLITFSEKTTNRMSQVQHFERLQIDVDGYRARVLFVFISTRLGSLLNGIREIGRDRAKTGFTGCLGSAGFHLSKPCARGACRFWTETGTLPE